jgi:hypothetical protein
MNMQSKGGHAKTRPISVLAAGLAGIAFFAAACGGGPAHTRGSAAYRKAVAYAQCIRVHGVPGFPSPARSGTVSLGGIDLASAQYQTALQDCQNLAPRGAQFQPFAAQRHAILSSALKIAHCMRAHGIPNFPDPSPTSIRVGRGGGVSISEPVSAALRTELQSPQGQAAYKACAPKP